MLLLTMTAVFPGQTHVTDVPHCRPAGWLAPQTD